MGRRTSWPLLSLVVVTCGAWAGDGLTLPDSDPVWPRWQSRLDAIAPSMQGVGLAPLATFHRGASLLGDYYPAWPRWSLSGNWQGGARASGGVLLGSSRSLGTHVWPYLGVGYTGLSRRSGWGFVADVGLVAHGPRDLATPVGQSASLEDVVREITLSPVLQLSVRYSF